MQGSDADGGTQGGAKDGSEGDEYENGPAARESVSSASEALHQPGTDDRFEGVAYRDTGAGPEGSRARVSEACQEDAQEDARPDAISPKQDRDQGNAGGRPHRGGAWVIQSQQQAESRGAKINGAQQED